MEQYMPIVWIGFAIFMLLCEGFTTQLVSIWFVLGSVCAAITTIFTSEDVYKRQQKLQQKHFTIMLAFQSP